MHGKMTIFGLWAKMFSNVQVSMKYDAQQIDAELCIVVP